MTEHPREYKQNSRHCTYEVADIFRQYGREYEKHYHLSYEQQDIMKALMSCRTEFLGGYRETCDSCGYEQVLFKSCRNRHCPKCQTAVKAKWLHARQKEVLPIHYFHLVFTLPHELNFIALCNKKIMGDMLFHAVSETLLQFGENPDNRLGGKIGILAILHTWDQQLLDHFHIHCLVPAGALTHDRTTWVPANQNFLFHVKALSKVFRAKFIHKFLQAYEKEALFFPESMDKYKDPPTFERFTRTLWKKQWVVFSKPAIEKPHHVLKYLARYVHRVAIVNQRIVMVKDGKVSIIVKDRENNEEKTVTIDAVEFIRRFFLHVLPKNFMRIRAYGFLANRAKKKDLALCKRFLAADSETMQEEKSTLEIIREVLGVEIARCPKCKKGTMHITHEVPPVAHEFSRENLYCLAPHFPDTS